MRRRIRPLEPLPLDFSLPGENDGYYLKWIDPHRGVSCRSLFGCDRDHKRADLVGPRPYVF